MLCAIPRVLWPVALFLDLQRGFDIIYFDVTPFLFEFSHCILCTVGVSVLL